MSNRKQIVFYILLLLPGLVVISFVIGYPTIRVVFDSFTNRHLIWPKWWWVGMDNYLHYLTPGSQFYAALRNSIVWTVAGISGQLVVGFCAALALHKIQTGKTLFRVLLIIPWTFPDASLAFVWRWILEPTLGVFNYFLINLGLLDAPVGWFGALDRAMASVVAMNIWFGYPFIMVAILAGLQSIPQDYFDVASIEGASALQTLWYVIIPSLKTILVTNVVLRGLWIFNNFSFIYLTTGGGPSNRTLTLPVLMYDQAWRQQWLGRASSLAVIALMILALMSFVVLHYSSDEV